ncbi:hypothetical protein SLW70_04980 [Flavobacterium sp. NG2]|uniref:hypothetical protein n=1 Tax=Flavobacterium sp. NG2 TaxID=3097547 RepID=UPI002A7EB48E|nr:hypothetical protein [Flavobacterium sp. NG2]WPR72496.1 hypothetical protein SLW70_04980 [Flavobacterium sp. NG2]
MNKLVTKIIFAFAIGMLTGTITGNLQQNKTTTYFVITDGGGFEIPKKKYDEFNKNGSLVNKKTSFNKELGFSYGAIASSSLIILFLIPSMLKKQDD